MDTRKLILAIDQGTSSTKSIIFEASGKVVAKGSELLRSYFPQHAHVEQDPDEIYVNVLAAVKKCIDRFLSEGGKTAKIMSCGISNQRETHAGNRIFHFMECGSGTCVFRIRNGFDHMLECGGAGGLCPGGDHRFLWSNH